MTHFLGSLLPTAVGVAVKSSTFGRQLPVRASNGYRWSMGRWLENRAGIEVDVPLEVCWSLWEDRQRIPLWMPWIKSVTVQQDNPALSRWTLSTRQFGRCVVLPSHCLCRCTVFASALRCHCQFTGQGACSSARLGARLVMGCRLAL
eukprot:GHRQ01025677.1.p1 GENE.GHRQ01025677.1~~GHRQ01025677.1.p1  ORF type:complete len:147 (-),score=1.01 GHRQ01025677.1:138-578(-)